MQNLTPGKLIPLVIVGLVALSALGMGGAWYVTQMWQHSVMMDTVNYGHKLPPVPAVNVKDVR